MKVTLNPQWSGSTWGSVDVFYNSCVEWSFQNREVIFLSILRTNKKFFFCILSAQDVEEDVRATGRAGGEVSEL